MNPHRRNILYRQKLERTKEYSLHQPPLYREYPFTIHPFALLPPTIFPLFFPPLRDKVVPRFRRSRIDRKTHTWTHPVPGTKIIFASSSFCLWKKKKIETEGEREGKMEKQWSVQRIKGLSSEKRSFVAGGWNWRKLRDIRSAYMPHVRDPFRRLVWISEARNNNARERTILSMVFVFFRRERERGLIGYFSSARCLLRRKIGGNRFHSSISRYTIKSHRHPFFPFIDLFFFSWELAEFSTFQYLKFVNNN